MCDVKLSQERVEGQFKQKAAPLNAQGRAGASCVGGRAVGGLWPTHSPGPGSCVTLQPQPGHNLSAVLSTWLPVPPHGWWALKVWSHWYPDPQCTSTALAAACLLLACTLEGHLWFPQSSCASLGLAKPANSSSMPRAKPCLLY